MATQKKQDVIVENGVVYVLRPGVKVFCKTADICAMIGKSNQWIGQLTSQGTLYKSSTAHGSLFDLGETMRAYCRMLEDRSEPDEDPEVAKNEREKQAAETGIKKAKAVISMLEASEMQGKMHRAEDVAAMTEDMIYSIRGMLTALPGRLAVDAAEVSTPAEAAELIRVEVFRVMEEISKYRYDPKKYEERVRERKNWEDHSGRESDDE
ncbi:MAG: hypothetical protein RR296_12350 [Clostridia bacterium]